MYELEEDQDEQLETIHVYFYEETPSSKHPLSKKTVDKILSITTSIFLLCGIIALCFIPNPPQYTTHTISVPVHVLPLVQFLVTSPITPTGTRTHPATIAQGTLMIYNGSILTQELPQGFILTAEDGTEIVTDTAITIPPGNPPAYGTATVSAHAATPSSKGNIPYHDIDTAYGTSLYLKNLTAFTGGADPQTEDFATSDDTHLALTNARYTLLAQEDRHSGLLASPCQENTQQKNLELTVSWACQFVTYTAPPGSQVVSAQVKGNSVLLQVKIVARPRIIIVK